MNSSPGIDIVGAGAEAGKMAQWLRPLSILFLQRTPSLVPSTHMAAVTIVPRTLKPSLASAGTGRAHGMQTDMGGQIRIHIKLSPS